MRAAVGELYPELLIGEAMGDVVVFQDCERSANMHSWYASFTLEREFPSVGKWKAEYSFEHLAE